MLNNVNRDQILNDMFKNLNPNHKINPSTKPTNISILCLILYGTNNSNKFKNGTKANMEARYQKHPIVWGVNLAAKSV